MNSRLQLIRLIVSSIALSLILTYSCNVGAKETTTDHVVYKTPKTKKKKNNCSNMCEPGCLEIFQGLSLEIPINPEDAKVENDKKNSNEMNLNLDLYVMLSNYCRTNGKHTKQ